MTKAIFSEKQPSVKTAEVDGKTTVFICLNETEKTVEDMEGNSHVEYEYDFNEWTEEKPDIESINKNPDKYIDYQPPKELTDKEKIASLEAQLEQTQVALTEVYEMIGG